MVGAIAGARTGLRWGLCVLAIVVAVVAIGSDSAEARRRKKFRVVGYSPPYAAIVVDANSGAVLHASEADSLRHPASLTKIMTLYLLFERLEAGKISLGTQMRVSEHAAQIVRVLRADENEVASVEIDAERLPAAHPEAMVDRWVVVGDLNVADPVNTHLKHAERRVAQFEDVAVHGRPKRWPPEVEWKSDADPQPEHEVRDRVGQAGRGGSAPEIRKPEYGGQEGGDPAPPPPLQLDEPERAGRARDWNASMRRQIDRVGHVPSIHGNARGAWAWLAGGAARRAIWSTPVEPLEAIEGHDAVVLAAPSIA